MLMTLIAAALAAAAPAAGQAPDPPAGHGKHAMTGALHGEMCNDCKPGEHADKHEGKAKDAACACCKDGHAKHQEQKGANTPGT